MYTVKNERIGEENYNTYGTLMRIVEYYNKENIIVEFQDEYRIKVSAKYINFKKGKIKNPYDKSIYNIGYIGVGEFEIYNGNKHTEVYKVWHDLIKRCYEPYFINKNLTYKDCIICEEWHCFQNFAEWYYKNYYECNNETMELDKDILFKNNKIYSSKTCIFVPHRINSLFVKCNKVRGEYPIGVSYSKRDNILTAQCNILDENRRRKNIHLGEFSLNKPFQAFTAYKNFKENYIKQVADEYKELIPIKLYEALYKYEVEIND